MPTVCTTSGVATIEAAASVKNAQQSRLPEQA